MYYISSNFIKYLQHYLVLYVLSGNDMNVDTLNLVPSRPQDTNPYNLVIVGVSCFWGEIWGEKLIIYILKMIFN